MAASIPKRALRVTIANETQTLTLTGYRMSAVVQHAGGVSSGQLFLTIWGLAKDVMLNLSTFGMKLNIVTKNSITLEAGDDQAGMAAAFIGQIMTAEADFNAQPEVALHIVAHCVLTQAVAPAKATSFRGSVGVDVIMSGFATQMGLRFENSGVNVTLRNPAFSGSANDQMRACAQHANVNAVVVDGVLAIWPRFGSRNGSVPLISPKTGMIGYPTFSALGVSVKSIFNRSVGIGQQVKIESEITAACGTFTVFNLTYELDCEMPDAGKWFTNMDTYNPKVPTPPSI